MLDLTPERAVAANARQLREAHGYTQERVAQLMTEAGFGIGEMALWALENGRRRIKVSDLSGLAAVFGVSPGSLLTESPEPAEALPPEYEVAVIGGSSCTVTADSTDVDDHGFLNFYVGGARVFFAPVAAVLFCRLAEEPSGV